MLQFVDIELRRAEQNIFSNLNWSVSSGEKVLLRGRNGTGKTSLLELLCGLVHPHVGRVLIDDVPLSQGSCSFMSYTPELFFGPRELTVDEHLALTASLALPVELRSSKVQRSIEAFGLNQFRERRCLELSRGYQKRLSLAMGFLPENKILLLDEPTSGLDSEGIQLLVKEIELLPESCTCIVVSHEDEKIFSQFKIVELRDGSIYPNELMQP